MQELGRCTQPVSVFHKVVLWVQPKGYRFLQVFFHRKAYFDNLVFEWVVEFGSVLVEHYRQDMRHANIEEEHFGNILAWVGEI